MSTERCIEGSLSVELIKPQLGKNDLVEILKKFYGLENGIVTQMNGYDDLNFHCAGSKICNNPYIHSPCPHGYTLKIVNSKDSEDVYFQESQTKILIFLREHGIPCPIPVKNRFGDYIFTEILPGEKEIQINKKKHVIKMFEFQPGILFKHVLNDYPLYYELGRVAAKLDAILKEYQHPAFENHESIWHMTLLPEVRSYTYLIPNVDLRSIVENFIDEFIGEVVPNMNASDKQIIHGDLNNQNVICQEDNRGWKISALIDFGDSHISYPLYEIAIAMCYVMVDCREKKLNPYIGSGHTLAGYKQSHIAFNFDHLQIKQCLSARLSQSYVLATRTLLHQPDNVYISENLELYSELLKEISRTPMKVIDDIWQNILNSYMT